MQTRVYGWKPQLPDYRDHRYMALLAPKQLPSSADLRNKMPVVYDQGQIGSCTGQATAAAIVYDRALTRANARKLSFSRLFLYYNGRDVEGTTKQDVGATIRDVVKAASKRGAADEALWPYIGTNVTKRPTKAVYANALACRVDSYAAVDQQLDSIRATLAEGFTIIFGFSVYQSFETQQVAKTGKMLMPQAEDSLLGGHAVLAVGYDDATQSVVVRNSWGTRWGDKGHFYMPYAYITNPQLAADFWVVRTTTA